MAMACFVERAPCLPSRMCRISSSTNLPAWVLGALPSRFACRAFASVCFSGMMSVLPMLVFGSTGSRSLFVPNTCLENLLGLFHLPPPRGRQTLAATINEILNHADARADTFRTNLLAGHGLGNRSCVLRKDPLGGIG